MNFDANLVIDELSKSDKDIHFSLSPAAAFMVISQLQLADRHPSSDGATKIVNEFIGEVATAIAMETGIEGLAELVEAGCSPAPKDDEEVSKNFHISSGVRRDYSATIRLQWNKEVGLITTEEAEGVGQDLISAAIAAKFDSALVRWAAEILQCEVSAAIALLDEIRKLRSEGNIPSTTLNLDGEHVRPQRVREMALSLLFNAFNAEQEALFAKILIDRMNMPAEAINVCIADLRRLRGISIVDVEGD